MDPKKLCRMCGKPYDIYISLTGSTDNASRSKVEAVLHFTGILVCNHDELSTRVCTKCFSNLEKCEMMRRRAIQAQGFQMKMLDPSYDSTNVLGQYQFKRDLKEKPVPDTEASSSSEMMSVEPEPAVAETPIKTEKVEDTTEEMEETAEEMEEITEVEYDPSSDDILLTCRVCLQDFTPISLTTHTCDISVVMHCNKCPLKFLSERELKEHNNKAHQQKKPGRRSGIKCVHCDQYFEKPEALENHLRLVGRQKSTLFNCEFCVKFFTNQEDIKNHVQEAHAQINTKVEYDYDNYGSDVEFQ